MDATGIGAYIRARRDLYGWTQERLSEATGISRARIAQIEGGRGALPGADTRRRLANALGVSHLDLLIAAGEINADEIEAIGRQGVTHEDPLLEPMLAKLRRVRWTPKVVAALDGVLDILLLPDRADLSQEQHRPVERVGGR